MRVRTSIMTPDVRAPQLLIVADDLSGALDTAAVFAATGLRTVVVPYGSGWRAAPECFRTHAPCDVLVVDTASRHAGPRTASQRVSAVIGEGRRRGVSRFYKKTDSTLRGNLGAELAAFRQAAGVPLLPFAPASPRVGRTTRRGQLLVDGVPLGRTAFARDRLNPVTTGAIARVVGAQSALPVWHVTRHDASTQADPSSRTAGTETGIVIFDAETDDDLAAIANRLRRTGLAKATAGSGGFAAALAHVLDFHGPPAKWRSRSAGSRRRPLLVVSGSRHPAATRQREDARSHGFDAVPVPAAVLAPRPGATQARLAERAATLLADGQDVLLYAAGQAPSRPGHDVRSALAVARGLGRLVSTIVGITAVHAVLASGGDTVAGIVSACRWTRLVAEAEIATGIALAATGDRRAPWVVSKAGGFGRDHVWVDLRESLRSLT